MNSVFGTMLCQQYLKPKYDEYMKQWLLVVLSFNLFHPPSIVRRIEGINSCNIGKWL